MIKHTVTIPIWLDFILALPVLAWRFAKFGYTYRKIYLGEGERTILDQWDYRRLCHHKWYLDGTGTKLYAIRSCKTGPKRTKLISMHREIMNFPEGLLVDHINGDSLDNRRRNLRLATRSQNNVNSRRDKSKTTSRFRGVSFYARTKKWMAKIRYGGKNRWLGYYDCEIEAAKAYDEAAKKYHGEFARLNFPQ